MKPDVLDALLVAWGHAFGEQKPSEWDEPRGQSPIARLEKPPKRRAGHVPIGRSGLDRRVLLGAAAGLIDADGRVRPVPAWACEPVPATETRPAVGAAPVDPRITSELQRVQDAWLAMRYHFPQRAEVLRMQYQVRAMTQKQKAEDMRKQGWEIPSVKRYRDDLAAAKVWMHARLAGNSGDP